MLYLDRVSSLLAGTGMVSIGKVPFSLGFVWSTCYTIHLLGLEASFIELVETWDWTLSSL